MICMCGEPLYQAACPDDDCDGLGCPNCGTDCVHDFTDDPKPAESAEELQRMFDDSDDFRGPR